MQLLRRAVPDRIFEPVAAHVAVLVDFSTESVERVSVRAIDWSSGQAE